MKADIEAAQIEEEQATREGDLARASELRYGTIPALQQKLAQAEEVLENRQQDGAILKGRSWRRRNRRGCIHVDGHSRYQDDAGRNG